MVGIVVVSHSRALAEGVVTLAREMGGNELTLEAAGGLDEPDTLGTDAERVRAAVERAMSPDGVLVLMDLGSALMSAELAIELLGEDAAGPVALSEAPLVEGAVAAAAAAAGGASLDEVAAEARGALAMKATQLGAEPAQDDRLPDPEPAPAGGVDASAELLVRNAAGLHARPAARLVRTARGFDADVRVARAPDGAFVGAGSLTGVIALGVRRGDTVLVRASGSQAREAVDALVALAGDGFGDDGPGAPAASGTPAAAAAPAAAAPAAAAPAPASAPSPGETLRGVAASSGIALGPARHLGAAAAPTPPPEDRAQAPDAERERLGAALDAARTAITRDRDAIAARGAGAEAEIFDAHLALLADEALLEPAQSAVAAGASADRAWYDAVQEVADVYRGLDEPLLRERAADVLDVGRRVAAALRGEPDGPAPVAAGIVVTGELTPADAVALDPATVTGIATAHGAATAHAAILARALGIPAVVGLGDGVLAIGEGAELLLDGAEGTLVVEPSADVARAAWERADRLAAWRANARARAHESGATRDGTRVEVFANLGGGAEAAEAVALGAEGVGLLRTEFLYLDRPSLPDEDEQVETLRAIATALDGRPLVVRTLDAGADKPLPALPMAAEANPFLGVRGIRAGLAHPDVLATQLRAILRVADERVGGVGLIKVMLPMVSVVDEVLTARRMLDDARTQTGINAPLQLGIMVEVPAAALTAAHLAEHVDFLSIGTNDLTQYAMAAERGNERLAGLLDGFQPAVLRLIADTVTATETRDVWVGVCGELAGDPAAAIVLAGLGVTELSMAPTLVPEVKAALRAVDVREARDAALTALTAGDAAQARAAVAPLMARSSVG